MTRVLATMQNSQYSSQFTSQISDLADWTNEILTATFSHIGVRSSCCSVPALTDDVDTGERSPPKLLHAILQLHLILRRCFISSTRRNSIPNLDTRSRLDPLARQHRRRDSRIDLQAYKRQHRMVVSRRCSSPLSPARTSLTIWTGPAIMELPSLDESRGTGIRLTYGGSMEGHAGLVALTLQHFV
jgi:hypothetical protein